MFIAGATDISGGCISAGTLAYIELDTRAWGCGTRHGSTGA